MKVMLCLEVSELYNVDALASVDTVVWYCRICEFEAMERTRDLAKSAAMEHLISEHRAVPDYHREP